MSPSNCVICYGPLDNNPAIDGAIIVCGECAIDPCLIAAAPALLEALVPLVDIAGSLLADRDGRAQWVQYAMRRVEDARAAIAQARGLA